MNRVIAPAIAQMDRFALLDVTKTGTGPGRLDSDGDERNAGQRAGCGWDAGDDDDSPTRLPSTQTG